MVKEQVLGESGTALRRSQFEDHQTDCQQKGLPVVHEDLAGLSPEHKRSSAAAARVLAMERHAQEMRELNDMYDPGTWRCSRCNGANPPGRQACGKYIGGKECGGSQNATWGGYVRKDDAPVPMSFRKRDWDVNYRGKYSGGVH